MRCWQPGKDSGGSGRLAEREREKRGERENMRKERERESDWR